ncbi:MAG: NADPH-dependent glutamate synthase [bacterium]
MAKLNLNRMDMPKQASEARVKNINEVALGYTAELALAEAKRCLQCKNSPCVNGCPVEINIPGFIRFIADGDFKSAIRVLKEKNSLPAVCGRVCPQEEQCEKLCVLNKPGAPIAIGRLERFAADWEAGQAEIEMPHILPSTGKKVAVVGSGPAGLTVASDLAKVGHDVTVFEALHEFGGVLMYGIPEFRLPKRIVKREIDYVGSLGVKMLLDNVIGNIKTVDELLREYEAIFIGTGAGLPWFMNVPGENYNGVYSANEYLTRANLMNAYKFPEYDTPIVLGKNVAVVGGGNVAMDCARVALRLGAERSMIVYRRSKTEMPARLEEIENAEEEGVEFHYLTLPVNYYGNDNGVVYEMECIKMELGEPDASGRRRPVPMENSNFKSKVDVIVVAIGNSPNPLIGITTPGLEIGKNGNLVTDKNTGKTSRKRIFAGGDIATGAATVIAAMGAGRIAARTIHECLQTGNW